MRGNNINMIAFVDRQQVYKTYRTDKTKTKKRDNRKSRANTIQAYCHIHKKKSQSVEE